MLTIEEVLLEQVSALAPEIASMYEKGWIETYPNDEYGIHLEDIQGHFENKVKELNEWREILNSPDRKTWIARSDGAVVGFSVGHKGERENELEYVYVAAEAQGKGIGTKLIEKCVAWLGSGKPVILFAASYNQKAINLYEKLGFQLVNENVPDKMVVTGKFIPTIKMVRQ